MNGADVFALCVWVFTGPQGKKHEVSAIYEMTEAQAREAAARKGLDVEGWKAKLKHQDVQVSAPPELNENGDPITKKWNVIFCRTQYQEIEVEAETEAEAKELAREELDDFDWDGEEIEVHDIEEMEGDE